MTDDPSIDRPKAIPRRLRFEILRRDGHTCRYCGATAPDAPLTVDHVIPRVLGGSDDPNNLVTACRDCNAGKASTSPDETIVSDVDEVSMMFAEAMTKAAEMLRRREAETAEILAAFESVWQDWTYSVGNERRGIPLPNDWRASVTRWLAAGLSVEDFKHLVRVAMEGPAPVNEKWRYFCGCCWRSLTDRQELARRLIEDGEV